MAPWVQAHLVLFHARDGAEWSTSDSEEHAATPGRHDGCGDGTVQAERDEAGVCGARVYQRPTIFLSGSKNSYVSDAIEYDDGALCVLVSMGDVRVRVPVQDLNPNPVQAASLLADARANGAKSGAIGRFMRSVPMTFEGQCSVRYVLAAENP